MKSVNCCALCQSGHLSELWDLPKLPLSETYGEYDETVQAYDQKLLMCDTCGHVQLAKQLDPDLLYGHNYHFVTANSMSTNTRLDSFYQFVMQHYDVNSKTVVDIGGNDPSLLKHFDAGQKMLIDPSSKQQGVVDGIEYVQGYFEDAKLEPEQRRTILCTHTLEHIADPVMFIQRLLANAHTSERFFFEVPCFEQQLQSGRLDAVFHQHYHYFHPGSIKKLLGSFGAHILGMAYNAYPTCGGSIMFAFSKSNSTSTEQFDFTDVESVAELKLAFAASLKRFQEFNQKAAQFIASKQQVFGFGASLLLPVIFYHLGEASGKIRHVLDDDKRKDGLGYRNLEGVVARPSGALDCGAEDGIIITSYENMTRIRNAIKDKFQAEIFEGSLS